MTVPTITGPDTVCTGSVSYIYYTESGMSNYLWSVSSGGAITSGQWSNLITVTWNSPGLRSLSVTYDGAAAPGTMEVTVETPVAVSVSIAVSSNPICTGITATFTATVTNGGISPAYQWRVNGVEVGTNNPVYSYVPDNGNIVTCQVTSDLMCTNVNPVTSSPIIMNVLPSVPASVSISASSNPACTGASVTFTATPFNGGTTPDYQWKVNGGNAGDNSSTYTYVPVNGDVITCLMTSNATCPTGNPATSNPIIMTVSPSLPVSLTITASANPSCQGNPVTFTAFAVNGGSSPSYEWKVNGMVAGGGTTFTYTPVNGDKIICRLTSSAGCATGNPALSNEITMTVQPFVPASVSITASSNPVCSSMPVTFTAVAVNGGSNPTYQWVVNGTTVVNNNPTFTYIPANGDVVLCHLTSNYLCVTGNPATSNSITMNVTPSLPASVSIVASLNPACQGTPVQYTATPVNGGASPTYQWLVNGTPAGTNNAIFTYVPGNGEIIKCQMTSSDPCNLGSVVMSNEIVMIVSPGLSVSITIDASTNPACTGSTVTFTSIVSNGGTSPVYDWYVNNVAVNVHTSGYSYVPLNGDIVTCQVSSSLGCATGNPAASNAITMTVSTALPVGITIAASSNPSCQGQAVTFTSTSSNEGMNPVYQWEVNGVSMGTLPELIYNPTNGDNIVCHLSSDFPCATGNPATSNVIHMTVNPFLTTTISITSSANPSCLGSQVTYTANTTNAGPTPAYQWKVNNLNAGNNQPTFTYVPANGDAVKCILTPAIPCPVTSPVISNTITQTVYPIVPAGISISASGNPVCTGTLVTFTPTVTNGGTNPVLQWKINGVNSGNQPLLIYYPANGDIITCQLTSSLMCASGNPVTSNSITMVVSSSLPTTATITATANPFCQGATVSFSASAVNAGVPTYQWKVNGVNKGTNSNTYSYQPINGDFITCCVTSSLWCATPNPAQSNPLLMQLNTSTPAGITITSSSNPVCTGNPVIFTATQVNGGPSPSYQWKKNRIIVGTNNPVFTYTPVNEDTITCTLTSNAACVSGSPVTSSPIIMNVTSALPGGVSISASTNPYCPGDSVSFTAVPANGGATPSFQWKVNGVNKGANSPNYKYPPLNGDQVTCWMTSNSTCISGSNPVVSNTLIMTATSSLPVSVSITVSQNPVCQGTAVIFVATPVNGGASPVYQWKIDGDNAGNNSKTFVYSNPVNGKTITCVVTSSFGCATGNPATSNAITMTVTPPLPVSATIAASSNPVCLGVLETFTATPFNGGTSPSYRWRVNGVVVDTTGPVFSYVPVNGDMVTCQVTSNATCISGNPAMSNAIVISVSQEQPVSVTIVASANPYCPGQNVVFTATPVNGGTVPFYEWFINNVNIGNDNEVYVYAPNPGDIVKCRLTSNQACICNNPAMSNLITMDASANIPVSVSITASINPVCAGTNVVFNATTTNGGTNPHYQWKINGVSSGPNSPAYQFPPNNGDVVTCVLTSNLTCAVNNPAISNPITMSVLPLMPVSVNIVASLNPACEGNTVCFTATVTNGGSSPFYRWRVNGANKGTNSPTYCYEPVNGDVIYCRVTSNETCASNNPANSNNIAMVMLPNATVGITIAASANPVCQGSSVTFTATPVNGGTSPIYQWKVNGVNAGTNSSTYTYTPVNGDVITCDIVSNAPCVSPNTASSNVITEIVSPIVPVSVSIVPSSNPVCQGSSVTFNAIPVNGGPSPSYQWKVNGVNAGSNSSLFTLTPVNGDVISCVMNSSAACVQGSPATSNSVTITVNTSMPVSVSISASSNPACQGQQVCYTATPVNGGTSPVYQWQVNGMNVGTNTPVFCYIPSPGDVVRCLLTSSYPCASGNPALSNSITVIFFPNLPVGVSITSSANPACQGIPVTFTAIPSNGGTSPGYQWKVNGSPAGTNSPIFSYTPVNGDLVICTLTSNIPCPINNPAISNPVTMSVLQPVSASVAITASMNPVCTGTQVVFTAIPGNGGSAPIYQWFVNGTPIGTSNQIFYYIPVNGDIITCQMTSSLTCVTLNPVLSNQITMGVSNEFPVSISVSASANPSCQGQSVTFSATAVNGGGFPAYQWKVNGINVGINSSTYTYVPTSGDNVICQVTSDYSCATNNPASSGPITMVVNPNLPVSVSITSSFNPACLGTSITYTATAVNGGASPSYQWKVNGTNAGSGTEVFTYTPANNEIITCQVSSSLSCTTGNPAMSNAIQMIVGSSFPVSISVSPSANPICTNTSVTFTATSSYGGSSPVYQWKVNGNVVGGNTTTYTYFPADGDQVSCTLTSDLPCATGNPAVSNIVSMLVLPVPVGISISCNPTGPICDNTFVTFTATPTNGGPNPTYKWKVNGNNAGTNSPVFVYQPDNGDVVTCTLTSNATCASGNTVTSNSITVTVDPLMPVSISVSANPSGPVCAGTTVTFTGSAINGGSTPGYQWKVNGVNVGGNTSVYGYVPVNGNIVTCVLTTSETCASGSPATSNPVTMTVNPNLPVSIAISANPAGAVCAGTPVMFTGSAMNGGSTPVYQWKVNGVNAGGNTSSYTYTPFNGDFISCTLTSNATCPTGNPAVSNTITATVNPILPVSIAITASANPVCSGTPVTFTGSAINGGSIPVYQWKVNGVNVGGNTVSYGFTPVNGDIVTCVLTTSETCASGSPATSNPVTMTVNPNLPVSISISANPAGPVCEGTPVTFSGTAMNGGSTPVYQWKVNGVNAGGNTSSYTYTPVNGDIISCILTSNATCPTGNPAASNMIAMAVNPNLPVSIAISANPAGPVCAGTSVTFTGTAMNGGSIPVYQWKVNGVNAGGNTSSYTYNPVNGDIISCSLTSNATCPTGNPASSNTINATVNPVLPVSIAIAASANPVCAGTPVTFTGSAINGGSTPGYQWKVNGVNVGGNTSVYGYVPVNGDIVTCVMTTSETCASGSPATSSPVTMTVNPNLPVSIAISANPAGPVCAGTPVTFTGTTINGGSTPVYQWMVNGVPNGPGNPVFIYTPANGDIISCSLTSNATCPTGNPAVSNTITATVNPILPVSIAIAASANPVCAGTPVTFTGSAINGGSTPVYQWKVNGVNAGGNTSVYGYVPVNGDVVTCVLTTSETCASGSPATSNPVTVTVNPNLPVSVAISANPAGPVCAGTPVMYTGTAMNGGSAPVYQWMVNGLPLGSDDPQFPYVPVDGDLVSCELLSNATCATGNPANSNTITMTVHPNLPVSVTITADPPGVVCEHTLVYYNASVINGGASPEYFWYVNGDDVGTNDPDFFYLPEDGDVVTCLVISNLPCPQGNPATSNPIAMTVKPLMPVSVFVTASPSAQVCDGTLVTFTALAFNGGLSPVFQWKVNGNPAGSDSDSYSYIPETGDVITCTLTSDAECATGNPSVSAPITMTVNPNLPVSIVISANPAGAICAGTQVAFTGTAMNGGSTPVYQWMVNGVPTGSNNPVFIYTPANGDIISCSLTSNATCPTGNPAASNTITETVDPILPVSMAIVANPAGPVCAGTSVTFTGSAMNGGSTPVYQWKVNGVNTGGNTNSYGFTPLNGDVVTCVLTTSETCASGSPATSNPVTVTVNPNLPVSIAIAANPAGPVCAGTSVTFTGSAMNGGSTPVYQWMVNGLPLGSDDPQFPYVPVNGDIVSCILTSNATCPTGNPATSNMIAMAVNPNLPVSIAISANPAGPVCAGTPVTFTGTPINGGSAPVYQWKINGVPAGPNSDTYTYTPLNGDVITSTVLSDITCPLGNPATSDPIVITVNPLLPVSIAISANPAGPVCAGTSVTFTGSAMNGGSTPGYQWKVNGINVGGNTSVYVYVPLDGDIVTCVLTTSETCASGSPATSNPVTMTVNPNLPVSIAISANPAGPVCAGTSVTFTGTAMNGGSAPVFQWIVNGLSVGGNTSSYTYTPVNGDIISCSLTSNVTCPTGNPASSNMIAMTVNPNLPVSITISANPAGPVCDGTSVTFTGTAMNGGSTPGYQWKVNGVNVGGNTSVYGYVPLDGDIVSCVLASNETCKSGNPATSNAIPMSVPENPDVSFNLCFDAITTTDAKPIRLKGGIPLGGIYSGSGVDSPNGMLYPSMAGAGSHQIMYTYTNISVCSDTAYITIVIVDPSPFICGSPVTDPRDGRSYPTIAEGSSCWMGANLNYGQQISSSLTQRDNCIVEKYCYDDNAGNCSTLGGFYHWDELMQYDDQEYLQGLCPPGWHVPGESDWNALFNLYSGPAYSGDYLKAGGSSGFNALLAGGYFKNRSWVFRNFGGFYWSSSSQGTMKAWAHGVNEENHGVSYYPSSRSNAYSVRCIKD